MIHSFCLLVCFDFAVAWRRRRGKRKEGEEAEWGKKQKKKQKKKEGRKEGRRGGWLG